MFGALVLAALISPLGFVTDTAQLLRPETIARLEQTLTAFKQETGHEVAIATIPALGSSHTIETYAVELFEEWGIGKEEEDDGLLLLIARDDREMRIEVGYGLEGAVPDIEAGRIISEVLAPAFQAGEYDAGVEAAIERIMTDIRNGAPISEPRHPFPWADIVYLVVILIIIFINIRRKWQGKSMILPIFFGGGRGDKGGGGFGGFGGGSSGGGGASGRW